MRRMRRRPASPCAALSPSARCVPCPRCHPSLLTLSLLRASQPGQGSLTVDAQAHDGEFAIENISFYRDEKLATELTAEADWSRRGLYIGPQVSAAWLNVERGGSEARREEAVKGDASGGRGQCCAMQRFEWPGGAAPSNASLRGQGAAFLCHVCIFTLLAMLPSLRNQLPPHILTSISQFETLDESVQAQFEAYLTERGIDSDLARFVPDFAELKEQRGESACLPPPSSPSLADFRRTFGPERRWRRTAGRERRRRGSLGYRAD